MEISLFYGHILYHRLLSFDVVSLTWPQLKRDRGVPYPVQMSEYDLYKFYLSHLTKAEGQR